MNYTRLSKLCIFLTLGTITSINTMHPQYDTDDDFTIINAPNKIITNPNLPCHALTRNYIIFPTQRNLQSKNKLTVEEINSLPCKDNEIVLQSRSLPDENSASYPTLHYYDTKTGHRTRIDKIFNSCSVQATLYKINSHTIDIVICYEINKKGKITMTVLE